MKTSKLTGLVVSLILVAGLFGAQHYLTYNQSPSAVPVGWYLDTYSTVHVGDIVKVCLPEIWGKFALARGYVQPTGVCPGGAEPLIKKVTAVGGDTVTVDPSSRMLFDTLGRPMPRFCIGSCKLEPNVIWLHGDAHKSFDSRYFGPVPIGNVLAVLTPFGHPQ